MLTQGLYFEKNKSEVQMSSKQRSQNLPLSNVFNSRNGMHMTFKQMAWNISISLVKFKAGGGNLPLTTIVKETNIPS